MKKHSGYLVSRTGDGSSSSTLPPEYDVSRAKKFGNQPRQRRESQYGSPEHGWIIDPDSILLAGVDCSSGKLENSPDQTFDAPGRSRRRRRSLLVPRSPQRRNPDFCSSSEPTKGDHVHAPLILQGGSSGQSTSSSPGNRNSEPSPLDKLERDPAKLAWWELKLLMPVGIDGGTNREVCNMEITQVPICTLFDQTVEPIFVAQVVSPARLWHAKDPCTVPTEDLWCCVAARELDYSRTIIPRPRYPGMGYNCVKAFDSVLNSN